MFLVKETMEREGMRVLFQREGRIKYLNILLRTPIHHEYIKPGPSWDTPSLWPGFIEERLFENRALVEALIPWFPHLFLTFGDLLCAAIRIALLLYWEFPRLPEVGAIRGKGNGAEELTSVLFMKTKELVLVENVLTSNIFADSSNSAQATPEEKAKKEKKGIRVTYH